MSPRIAVVGGGPGGLFLATLVRRALPESEVTLFERNQATDVFGFGVVFSDATLRRINAADPVLRDALTAHGRHWDRIEVWSKGERHGFSGNGMAAIHRRVLLKFLQDGATSAGVHLNFGRPAPPVAQLQREFDVVVGADGANSTVREELLDFDQSVESATAKFIWFGTSHPFDGLTFVHRVCDHGNFAVHAYPIGEGLSTFIVETDEATWRRAGLDEFDVAQPPGPSDNRTQSYLEALFADDIEGATLVANNSRWANFRTRRTPRWHQGNVVLLGDAVHTAHFSVGSGTKMAMEDAISLAGQLHGVWTGGADLEEALTAYHAERSPSVDWIQDAATPSLAWWEHFGSYQRNLDPLTFAFHFFSRSIGVAKIEERDPALAASVRQSWQATHGAPPLESSFALLPGEDEACFGRLLTVESVNDGLVELVSSSGARLRLTPPDNADPALAYPSTGFVPAIVAPADVSHLPLAIASLPESGAVAIHGGDELARVLLSEHARLNCGLTSILVGSYDAEAAETLLLSGRADAVAVGQIVWTVSGACW
jgi:anthraniloyl-CoA monooxygenase